MEAFVPYLFGALVLIGIGIGLLAVQESRKRKVRYDGSLDAAAQTLKLELVGTFALPCTIPIEHAASWRTPCHGCYARLRGVVQGIPFRLLEYYAQETVDSKKGTPKDGVGYLVFEFDIDAKLPDFQVNSGVQQDHFKMVERPVVERADCARLRPNYNVTSNDPLAVARELPDEAILWFLKRVAPSYNPIFERAEPTWDGQLIEGKLYLWKYTHRFVELPKTPEEFVVAIRDGAALGKLLAGPPGPARK